MIKQKIATFESICMALIALCLWAPGAAFAGDEETPDPTIPPGYAEYEWESAEGGDYEGPVCDPQYENDDEWGNYTCAGRCAGVWHRYGSNPRAGSISVMFTCGNAASKAAAINRIVSYFTILPVCSGSCSPATLTCSPTGLWSSTSDGVDLKVDNKAPFCGYTATWAAGARADFTPQACKCI